METFDFKEFHLDSSKIKSISDNRDTKIMDFLDQSGSLQSKISNIMPVFSIVSVISFLSIGTTLRILASGNISEFDTYLKSQVKNFDLIEVNSEKNSAVEIHRIVFAKQLVYLIYDAKTNSKNLDFIKLHNEVTRAIIIIENVSFDNFNLHSAFDQINSCSWNIEKLHYLFLILYYIYKFNNDIRDESFHLIYSDLLSVRDKIESIIDSISTASHNILRENGIVDETQILMEISESWKSSFNEFTESCSRIRDCCNLMMMKP
jgi:hypothetical protein